MFNIQKNIKVKSNFQNFENETYRKDTWDFSYLRNKKRKKKYTQRTLKLFLDSWQLIFIKTQIIEIFKINSSDYNCFNLMGSFSWKTQ